jgi:hypothetical protein
MAHAHGVGIDTGSERTAREGRAASSDAGKAPRWRVAVRALAKRQKRPFFRGRRLHVAQRSPIGCAMPRAKHASRGDTASRCMHVSMRASSATAGKFRHACMRRARKPSVSFAKAVRDHAPVAIDSPKRRIASAYSETFPDPSARSEVMRRVALVVVLCATACVAACSDDAPHDAHAADASQQAGGSSGAASAFNSDAGANAAASAAAPLAPPVIHYPPDDDDDAKPATNATNAGASGAAASSPH